MDAEPAWSTSVVNSRRHSSVVSMPQTRRTTASVVTPAGIDMTIHMAAAVAAAVAATDTETSVGRQTGSSINRRRWSTAGHMAAPSTGLRRQQLQQQIGVNVTELRSVSDAVLSVSIDDNFLYGPTYSHQRHMGLGLTPAPLSR